MVGSLSAYNYLAHFRLYTCNDLFLTLLLDFTTAQSSVTPRKIISIFETTQTRVMPISTGVLASPGVSG